MKRVPGAALLIAFALTAATTAHAQSPTARANVLPADLGLGVLSPREDHVVDRWMPSTEVPWTYAYDFLAGGADTDEGWQHIDRQYPLTFAREAASHGYTPVLIYDQLIPNEGPCQDCEETERTLAALNDDDVMAAYYKDFTKALRFLSQGGVDGLGFGGTVIVDVQPHLSGFAQGAVADEESCFGFCTGEGDDPSLLRASVKSSGNEDVAGFEDTYRGFNAAMLHLRDTYAPNVRLGFHISAWGVQNDISRSDDSQLDAEIIGDQTGAFAVRSGTAPIRPDVSTYDVLFNDLDWADAGYLKYTQKWDPAFWDRRNVQFPNFRRWLRWVSTITQRTGLPMLVNHIPVGNQSHVAVDNTEGHFQDNRAEYFLSHTDEVRAAGIAALLFGSPTTGATAPWDGRKDGVHNPKRPVCTSDGDSSGVRICPTVRTNFTDDDGGFLRMQAAAFYRALEPAGASLPIVPIVAVVVVFGAVVAAAFALRRRRQAQTARDATTVPGSAPDGEPSGPITAGSTFASGRFEIVRELGAGGMKRVYLARDTLLDRTVAIGVVRAEQVDDATLGRARREVRALAQLGDHQNVVTVYDTGDDNGRPYFVCQYLPGGSLHERIHGPAPIGVDEAVRLSIDVCEALAHAHAGGIMHRDVKPANVWLDDKGRALLGDFGLAATMDRTKVTSTGAILGTVSYMAPEQAMGEPVPASDMYAVGAMLHELLTGKPPFEGTSMGVLHQHLNAEPPRPSARNSAVPPALDELVVALLAKEPGARPDAAATVVRLREIAARVASARSSSTIEETAEASAEEPE